MALEKNDDKTHLDNNQPKRKHKGRVNNTSGPSSKVKRLTRQLAGLMAHLEKNPKDVLSQQRVATINQLLRQ